MPTSRCMRGIRCMWLLPRSPRKRQLLGRRLEEVIRSEAPAGAVIAGDGSAEHDAPVPAERSEGRREVLAADVVEVHVDSVRRAARQLVSDAAPRCS